MMKERIIDVAKDIVSDTESFCNKYDVDEKSARGAKIWRSTYDEIQGIIVLAMELFGYEVEDYPITYLQELQDTIEKKIQ